VKKLSTLVDLHGIQKKCSVNDNKNYEFERYWNSHLKKGYFKISLQIKSQPDFNVFIPNKTIETMKPKLNKNFSLPWPLQGEKTRGTHQLL